MPHVGEIILFTPNPGDTIAKSNHNNDDVAAMVTRVWSHGCVNIKIFPDCGATQDRTSVVHQSMNPAGYHFRFVDEEHLPKPSEKLADNSADTKDASGFLTQHEIKAMKDHVALNTPMSI